VRVLYTKMVGDLFHPGHVHFLRRAREAGDRLVVHVVSDERVEAFKGRRPVLTQDERMTVVGACRYVDEVVADGPREITTDFLDGHGYAAYVFAWSDARELESKRGECSELDDNRVLALPATPGISTTMVRGRVGGRKGRQW